MGDSDCRIREANNAWMLTSTMLVLGMTPALALFEGGMLRSKNTMSIVMQTLGGLMILCSLWHFVGYTLTLGPTVGGFIGNFDHAFMINVSYTDCNHIIKTVPAAMYALFMCMFAAITPLLITGAYAERVKVKSSLLFSVLFEITVFYPVGHWIWGGGWMATKLQVQDFAGGIVIHATAGTAAFVVAYMLGRRNHYDKYEGEFPPSNLPLAVTGAGLLWMGWFGFNGGSALAADSGAVSAVFSTQVGACMSGMVWVALSWLKGKPNSVACLNGVIGGLAGVTPASGFINNQYSIFLGILLGVVSFFGQRILKHNLRVDDALDVSIVHGLTGIVGAIFIGFAGDSSLVEGSRDGLFYGEHSASLLGAQLAGTAIAMAWAGFWSVLIYKFIDRIWGMKVSHEEEELGLDIVEHNEYAYHNIVLRQGNVETHTDLESALTTLESPFMSESKRLLNGQ